MRDSTNEIGGGKKRSPFVKNGVTAEGFRVCPGGRFSGWFPVQEGWREKRGKLGCFSVGVLAFRYRLRVPAVYLRLAFWAFLAIWARRKMSKLRVLNTLLHCDSPRLHDLFTANLDPEFRDWGSR